MLETSLMGSMYQGHGRDGQPRGGHAEIRGYPPEDVR